MTPNNLKLCMGCMNPLPEGENKCRHCGYQEGMPHSLTYLSPGTVLKERYLIGKVLEKNSEGATYISFDQAEDKKVLIREFMPEQIAERSESNQSIRPRIGCERQYKTALSDFVELSRQLLALERISGIVPVLDRFVDNETVYVVYRYIYTLNLSDFLQRNGGELTWSQAKKMFLPLLNTLSQLHKKGIIHRGISPETILVDQDNKLWLSGFCIADARTEGSDVGAELFDGYAAPEQYSLSNWQGTWTDVYSIGAILYRTLTGTRPSDGNSRRISDDLCPANELNRKIPPNISDAIYAGMTVSSEKRIQSIDEFTGILLEEGDSHTAVFESSKVNLEVKKKQKKQKKARVAIWAMLVTLLILLGLMLWFLKTWGLFDKEEISRPTQSISYLDDQSASADSMIPADGVPDFVGMNIDIVKNESSYAERFEFKIEEDFYEEYPKGTIYNQEPAKGTPMPNRGQVTLYVSKGPDIISVPPLEGLSLVDATKVLGENELVYEVIPTTDSQAEAGRVFRMNPAAGDEISRKSGRKVYLYVKDETAVSSAANSSPSGIFRGPSVGIKRGSDSDDDE